jgi:hypothetical protein
MGVVHRVFDREAGGEVALKTLPGGLSADGIYHLKREFRLFHDLRHPNLVRLHELFVERDWCFFTMELVDGLNFVDHIRQPSERTGHEPTMAEMEARFRDAGLQLAAALVYLHGLGRFHRDIKPSNLLVTRTGRLVMLDFGVAEWLGDDRPFAVTPERSMVGTPEYMAPEQAFGAPPSAAADWYAVGVTFYEALAGVLPASGRPAELFASKRRTHHPREKEPDVSVGLDQLVAQLLEPEPARRAAGTDVVASLKAPGTEPSPDEGGAMRTTTSPVRILGRDPQLEALRAAFGNLASQGLQVVEVQGPSGIGKTSLVRAFLAAVEPETPIVLRGRCHLQETVAFNALDGVVDDLARHLADRPGADVVLPRDVVALRRLFPVLDRVRTVKLAPGPPGDEPPREMRHRGLTAFVELLARVADRHPLVVWIDDLQWADLDSFDLLAEVLRARVPPRLMLIVSFRDQDTSEERPLEAWARLRASVPSTARTEIDLRRLDEDTCLGLATEWVGRPAQAATLQRAVVESGGSPYLLREICQFLKKDPAGPDGVDPRNLGRALTLRLKGLDAVEQEVIRIVAAAGGPVEETLLGRACRVSGVRAVVNRLSAESFLRRTLLNGVPSVDTYHDRIRAGVTESVDADSRRRHHRSLAQALLEQPGFDAQRVAEQLLAAGAPGEAREHVLAAADNAAAVMAFARAAAWYRKAIEIGHERDPVDVRRRLGQALANAGLGAQAAEAFGEAADLRERVQGPNDVQTIDLRRAVGQSYLDHGLIEQGMAVFERLFAQVGIAIPHGIRPALRLSAWQRLRFFLRGSRFRPTDAADLPAATLVRLDMLKALDRHLSLLNHVLADAVFTRFLLESLRAGEPRRIIWCLLREACAEASIPGSFFRRRAERLLERSAALLEAHGEPVLEGAVLASRGVVAWMGADWSGAADLLNQARALFLAKTPGAQWEIAFCDSWGLAAETHLGLIKKVSARMDQITADAVARGDRLHLRNCLVGAPTLVRLAADQADRLLEDLARARELVPDSYGGEHYLLVLAEVQAALYQGEPAHAWAKLTGAWSRLAAEQLLKLSYIRDELWALRGRTAVALACASAGSGSVEPMLAEARRCVRRLHRDGLPIGRAWADLISAALAAVAGDPSRQRTLLLQARKVFDALGMVLWRESVGVALSLCPGDPPRDKAASDLEQHLAQMKADGVVRPDRMLRLLVPGLTEPVGRGAALSPRTPALNASGEWSPESPALVSRSP